MQIFSLYVIIVLYWQNLDAWIHKNSTHLVISAKAVLIDWFGEYLIRFHLSLTKEENE